MRNWFIPFQRDCSITKRDDESKTNEARAAYRSESSGIDSSYAACKKFVRGTMYNKIMAELKVAFTKGVYRKDGYNQSHESKKILYIRYI